MNKTIAVSIALAAALLSGCETAGQKEVVGGALGAAAGGLLGSQFGGGTGKVAATALGAVGGLLLGANIGRSMDDVDKMKNRQTTRDALEGAPSGTTRSWNNPDSGNHGTVTPTRTYTRADGTPCREFTQVITVDKRTEEARGTACRQPDGTWKIVS